jgi:hypothetical protein
VTVTSWCLPALVDWSGRAEPFLPPLDRNDPQRQVKGATVEFLGQLGDDHDPVGEPLAAEVGLDLNRRAAALGA